MAGFTCVDDIIAAISANAKGQSLWWNKIAPPAASGGAFSSWYIAGFPSAGTFGTALTARTVTSASAGAWAYTNPAGGEQMHLLHLVAGGGWSTTQGIWMLIDRLLEAPFDGTVTSGTFNSGTPIAIPARDMNGTANGDGVMMFLENAANTTTTARNLTVTYTNQGGTGGHSTGAQAMGALGQHRIFGLESTVNGFFLPLASGDTGVRKIESYTLSGSMTSTQLNIVLCRPIAIISNMIAYTMGEDDLVLATPSIPRIYDSSALQWLFIETSSWQTSFASPFAHLFMASK